MPNHEHWLAGGRVLYRVRGQLQREQSFAHEVVLVIESGDVVDAWKRYSSQRRLQDQCMGLDTRHGSPASMPRCGRAMLSPSYTGHRTFRWTKRRIRLLAPGPCRGRPCSQWRCVLEGDQRLSMHRLIPSYVCPRPLSSLLAGQALAEMPSNVRREPQGPRSPLLGPHMSCQSQAAT